METKQPEFIIEPPVRFSINLQEIWRYRELFYFFAWRDVKVKYKQTVLGILWVLLQPLMLVVVFTFFFSRMLGVGSLQMPYPLFALSGIVLWNFFSASVTNSGNSMLQNAPIIKKIYFPRLIIPIASIISASIDLIIGILLFLIVTAFYPVSTDFLKLLICWPAALALTLIGTSGLGCWLSALSVKYRDFRFVIPFLIQLGFFVTPVVYTMNSENYPWLPFVLAINPIYGALLLFRAPFLEVGPDSTLVAISALSTVVIGWIGVVYFKKTESFFADLA